VRGNLFRLEQPGAILFEPSDGAIADVPPLAGKEIDHLDIVRGQRGFHVVQRVFSSSAARTRGDWDAKAEMRCEWQHGGRGVHSRRFLTSSSFPAHARLDIATF